MTWDYNLFLALNFDGGETLDRTMLTLSGTAMWLPLYALILYLVWHRYTWRGLLLFIVLLAAAIGLADIIASIFKANGLMGNLIPSFEPRWRPMFTPALEGIEIAPDSLRRLRMLSPDELTAAGYTADWVVHVPREAVAGRYGTVSAHAATVVALAAFAIPTIRRYWFTVLMVVSTLLVCYSRIYLAKHYPMDLIYGTLLGLALGVGAWLLFRAATRRIADRPATEANRE